MANKQTHAQKFHIKVTLDAGTGVKGETNGYRIYGETTLRVTPTGVGGTNVIDVEGRLESETTWTTAGSITGTTSGTVDISTYDYIRFNTTTADSTGEVIVSGFFNQVGSLAGTAAIVAFKTIQCDAGTSPVADSPTDTLTFTSADASVTITGNSTTDTIDLAASGGGLTPPGSSTDNAIVRWDGTGADTVQDTSNVLIDDDGRISQTGLSLSTFFGQDAGLNDNLTSNANTSFGYFAGKANVSGANNVNIGYQAGNAHTGSNCIHIGYFAGGSGTSSIGNTLSGQFVNFYNQTGDGNTMTGYQAGFGVSGNSNFRNTFYGYQAGNSISTGTDNILLGYNVDLPSASTSNHLNIGDLIYGDLSALEVGINVAAPTSTLHVDQTSSSGAKPVIRMNQADIDDSFIDFVGTSASDGSRSISSDTTEDSAKFGAIRIEINGTTKWIRIYDDES